MLVSIGNATHFTGTRYLNNQGTRWISYLNGKRERITVTVGDETVTRTVLFYEQWCQFVIIHFRYKNERYTLCDGTVKKAH